MEKKKKTVIPTPPKGTTSLLVYGLLLIAAFLIGRYSGQVELLQRGQVATTTSPQAQPGTSTQPQTGQAAQQAVVQVSVDDDPFIGKEDAPLTMIEFSDFECPFCKRFWEDTLPQLKTNYIETGKLKFVYRDLPLPFHDPLATQEALAANCAREQGGDGVFFRYHDEIFTRTKSGGTGMPKEELYTIAADLGLDGGKFRDCLDNEKFKDEVQSDIAEAQKVGASGTPTLLIGKTTKDGIIQGERIIGAQPYPVFQQVIDRHLTQ